MHSFGYVHNFNIFQLYHGLYDGFVWTFRDSFQLVAISMWKNEALYNIYNPTMCSFLSFNKRCMWLSPTPSLWSQSLPGPPTPFPRDLFFCNEEQGGRIWDWGKLYTIQRKGYKVCNNSIFEVAIVANKSVNIVIASEKSMKARTLPPFLTG